MWLSPLHLCIEGCEIRTSSTCLESCEVQLILEAVLRIFRGKKGDRLVGPGFDDGLQRCPRASYSAGCICNIDAANPQWVVLLSDPPGLHVIGFLGRIPPRDHFIGLAGSCKIATHQSLPSPLLA